VIGRATLRQCAGLVALVGAASSPALHAAEISPQLSILSPLEFNLSGAGYEASLGSSFLTIPLFSIEAGTALWRGERYSVAGIVRFGFGQKRANARLEDTGGLGVDLPNGPAGPREGSLQWMPLLLGARTRFFLPAVPFFRPSLTAGFGGAWVRFLPEGAAAVNSFVPLAFVTPAIHIFEPIEAGGDAVFQGFTFGLSYQRALFSVQHFQALAFEVSAQWQL
jgi:hypothetical protein